MAGFKWLQWSVVASSMFLLKPLYAQDSVRLFRNSLEAGFRYEAFNKSYYDRTYTYIQYGRSTNRIDAFFKILQYSLGANKEAYQFESDLYWRHRKSWYSNFNGAYSSSALLPNYRFRAEIFKNVRQFELSLGGGVSKPHHYSLIPIISGTLGYYFGDYFIFLRPTFTLLEDRFTSGFQLNTRKYFDNKKFVGLMLLRGSDSGTLRNLSSAENSFGNDTYLIRFYGQFKIKQFKIGGGIDYGGILIPQHEGYANFVGVDFTFNHEF